MPNAQCPTPPRFKHAGRSYPPLIASLVIASFIGHCVIHWSLRHSLVIASFIGFCSLFIGHWSLVIGFWSLVFGHCSSSSSRYSVSVLETNSSPNLSSCTCTTRSCGANEE